MAVAAPAILNKSDSKKFKEGHKADPSIPVRSEGGWTITRPRHTRRPRRVFTLGFTDVSDTEKTDLQTLWENARGGFEIITGFTHPVTGAGVNVRFKIGSMIDFTYKGHGGNHRWDASSVVLEEV